jgi:hypothetical protein
LPEGLKKIKEFAAKNNIRTYEEFNATADNDLQELMEMICTSLQDPLKEAGDWIIYPMAVHDLIARGRVEIDGRSIFVDGQSMPVYGFRPDEKHPG